MKPNGKTTPPPTARPVALRALYWRIDRWRHSTAYTDMTIEEQGAYRNVLDEVWLRGGSIPNKTDVLAKACGDPRRWVKVKRAVLAHFRRVGGTLVNETLSEIREQSQRRADHQRAYRQRQAR